MSYDSLTKILASDTAFMSLEKAKQEQLLFKDFDENRLIFIECVNNLVDTRTLANLRAILGNFLWRYLAIPNKWLLFDNNDREHVKTVLEQALFVESNNTITIRVALCIQQIIVHDDEFAKTIELRVFAVSLDDAENRSLHGIGVFKILAENCPQIYQNTSKMRNAMEIIVASATVTRFTVIRAYNFLSGFICYLKQCTMNDEILDLINATIIRYLDALELAMAQIEHVYNGDRCTIGLLNYIDYIIKYMPNIVKANANPIFQKLFDFVGNKSLLMRRRLVVCNILEKCAEYRRRDIITNDQVLFLIAGICNLMDTNKRDITDNMYEADGNSAIDSGIKVIEKFMNGYLTRNHFSSMMKYLDVKMNSQNVMTVCSATYIVGTIVGSSKCLPSYYIERAFGLIENSVSSPDPEIEAAGLFVLANFQKCCKSEMAEYAERIYLILTGYIIKLKNNEIIMHEDKLFKALGAYCCDDKNFSKYFELIICPIFDCLEIGRYSVDLRKRILKFLIMLTRSCERSMLPYVDKILSLLTDYQENEDTAIFGKYIVKLTSALIYHQTFYDIPMNKICVKAIVRKLKNSSLNSDKTALYDMLGASAKILKTDFEFAFHHFMNNIFITLSWPISREITRKYSAHDYGKEKSGCYYKNEPLLVEAMKHYKNVCERNSAIYALMEFTKYSGKAFMRYIFKAIDKVLIYIRHDIDYIAYTSISAMKEFIMFLNTNGTKKNVAVQSYICLDMIIRHLKYTEDIERVLKLVDFACYLFTHFNEHIGSSIKLFKNILILTMKYELPAIKKLGLMYISDNDAAVFQDDKDQENVVMDNIDNKDDAKDDDSIVEEEENENVEEEENENVEEEQPIENFQDEDEDYKFILAKYSFAGCAASILPCLKNSMTTVEFESYFEEYLAEISIHYQSDMIRGNIHKSISNQHILVISISRCIKLFSSNMLDKHAVEFALIFLENLASTLPSLRRNSALGIIELLKYAGNHIRTYFKDTLKAIERIFRIEKIPYNIDIYCGLLAQTILSNREQLHVEKVYRSIWYKMPITEDFRQNEILMHCFKYLYDVEKDILMKKFVPLVKELVDILYNSKYLTNSKTKEYAVELLKNFRKNETALLERVISKHITDPEKQTYLTSIFSD